MTFDIETLELATEPLLEKESKQILEGFSSKIKATSPSDEKIVNYGKQSFIRGMHQAYADHRPFTLSPDILWLLICQGFSRHINYNSKDLQKLLVGHKEKKELIVRNDNLLKKPEEWKNVITSFTEEVEKNTQTNLVEILSPNFSTTTSVSKIACEITILDTFKAFFEYTVITTICGIPSITLKGNLEDWIKLKEKAQELAAYKLDWWIDPILLILNKIIETKKGTIDKPFWRNMYKTHTPDEYGASEKITGWIATFFPYDRFGIKTALETLDINNLPDELTSTSFKWIITGGLKDVTLSMQFVAGFIGLSQCPSSLSLEPQIGWFVSEAIEEVSTTLPIESSQPFSNLNFYQIDKMPREILQYKHLSGLSLSFNEKVKVPFSIGKIDITWLNINGKITEKEKNKLNRILPFTVIVFNGNQEEARVHLEKKNYFYKFISRIRRFVRL